MEGKKVFQMGFDISEESESDPIDREILFHRIEELINNTPNFKSLGIFNTEDMTEAYKKLGV